MKHEMSAYWYEFLFWGVCVYVGGGGKGGFDGFAGRGTEGGD